MIAINLTKAKAIAQKLAEKLQDPVKVEAHKASIDTAQSVDELATIMQSIQADLPAKA